MAVISIARAGSYLYKLSPRDAALLEVIQWCFCLSEPLWVHTYFGRGEKRKCWLETSMLQASESTFYVNSFLRKKNGVVKKW